MKDIVVSPYQVMVTFAMLESFGLITIKDNDMDHFESIVFEALTNPELQDDFVDIMNMR